MEVYFRKENIFLVIALDCKIDFLRYKKALKGQFVNYQIESFDSKKTKLVQVFYRQNMICE
jgi:hypothetical protein